MEAHAARRDEQVVRGLAGACPFRGGSSGRIFFFLAGEIVVFFVAACLLRACVG